MQNKLLYKGSDMFTYAASMAATWIWAPALFVSAEMTHTWGIAGLLVFLVPNVLALLVFGDIASYVVSKYKGRVTFGEAMVKASPRQVKLHLFVGTLVLICSTVVQFLGMYTIAHYWLGLDRLGSALLISLLSFAIVCKSGIKGSIISDKWKYLILLVCCAVLVTQVDIFSIQYIKDTDYSSLVPIGITTAIGLLSAPYTDQTFWQRAYSCEPREVKKTFRLTALLFGVVPLCFGLVGFQYYGIGTCFGDSIAGIAVGVAVFMALLSTVDSNLCAFGSIAERHIKEGSALPAICLLLLIAGGLSCTGITIATLFLLYGTIRSATCIPFILTAVDRFDSMYLLAGTVIGVLCALVLYPCLTVFLPQYAWIGTLMAFISPLIGFRPKALN